jgi:Arc/MetJ-type ribon-helix-helix transcriptional regulator
VSLRDKIVTIRLTAEEYREFENLRAARAMATMSDLTRIALRTMAASEDAESPLWFEVRSLQRQVQTLSADLEDLMARMESRKRKDAASR